MQTKKHSFIEQILNVGSGFFVSFLIWIFIIIPTWDLEVNMMDNIMITVIFTVVSVIRGYAWRRAFNAISVKQKEKLNE